MLIRTIANPKSLDFKLILIPFSHIYSCLFYLCSSFLFVMCISTLRNVETIILCQKESYSILLENEVFCPTLSSLERNGVLYTVFNK